MKLVQMVDVGLSLEIKRVLEHHVVLYLDGVVVPVVREMIGVGDIMRPLVRMMDKNLYRRRQLHLHHHVNRCV